MSSLAARPDASRPTHPRIAELRRYLDESRAVLMAALATVPESRRDERASDDLWTVGEVLDHLAIIERNVARLIVRRAERGRAEGLGPDAETSSLLTSLDHYRIDSADRRIEAPEQVRPRTGAEAAAALQALEETRRALQAAIDDVDGLDLCALTARHPIVGEIDLYRWLLLVGKHERRHALQLERLREALAIS